MAADPNQAPLADTDRCVLCGMCLPLCPTYGLSRSEAESPRGRISLIQALVRDQLALDRDLEAHLDHCLGCRACERACPSQVPYGRLLDAARAEIRRRHGARPGALLRTVASADKLQLAGNALRLYQRSGLRNLLRRPGAPLPTGLRRLEALLPELGEAARLEEVYPAHGREHGRIALFTGCIGSLAERSVLDAAIQVLTALGYTTLVPPTQGCCGALHQHDGFPEQARTLAEANLATFAGLEADAIVSTASGCGAQLVEYGELLANDAARALSARVQDISSFLATADWPQDLAFAELSTPVLLHTPCSLRNVLRQTEAPAHLLRRVPGLRFAPLADDQACCGAAGAYLLREGENADRLLAPKLAQLPTDTGSILLTSNTGCRLHWQAGIRQRGLACEVLHPVELLARLLVSTHQPE